MKSKFISLSAMVSLAVALTAGLSTAQTQLPTFGKAFSPSTIGPGSTTTLTFTITNSDSSPVSGLSFTDVLPAGMTIASPASVDSDCRGALSAPDGGTTISLTDGSIGGNTSCTISVNVTASAPGNYLNTSGDLTSAAGNSGGAEAELIVDASRPGFSKSFSPGVVRFGGRSTLTFTIDNSLNASGAFGPSFLDELPLGMVVADPANVFTDCANTTVTAVPGSDIVRLTPNISGAVIAAGATCTVSVDVVGGTSGPLGNSSGSLSTAPSSGGTERSSGLATALLTVTTDPIVLTGSFLNDPVGPGGTVDLEFEIFNLSRDGATDISFTSDLDAVLPGGGLEATGLPIAVCGGTLSTPDGGETIEFSGGSLPGSNGLADGANSCSFSVTLQVPSDADFGEHVSTTSAITADADGLIVSGDPASDSLFIAPVLTLTKSFTDDPVAAGGSVTLEYTLANSNPNVATGISFSDELTTFLPATVTADLPADGFCGAGSAIDLVSPGIDRLSVLVTGAEIPANSSCTFSITINVPVDVSNGSYPSSTSAVTGTVDGAAATGASASDSLVVVGLPTLSKSFVQNPVLAGATTTLEFTLALDENATSAATNLSFTDALGAALSGLATTPGLSVPDVCGVGSSLMDSSDGSDGSEISLVGGSLQPGQSCTFSVDVFVPADADSGAYTNTTSSLLATVGGLNLTGASGSDVLNVANLVLTKEFIDDPVIAGGDVTLRYTLTNNSSTLAATSIEFEDDLGDVLPGLSASGLPLSDICGNGSGLVGSAGNSVLAFVSGSLDPLGSCSFDVTLNVPPGTASHGYVSSTSDFAAIIDETAIGLPNASDTLIVSSELLELTKSFTDDPVDPGGTVTLEFTLSNPSSSDITDISFTDDLGAALPGLVATGLPAAGVCGPGSSLSGTSVLTLSGGSLAAGTDCTFSVTLQVPANLPQAITVTNTTSAVSGLVGNLAVSAFPASDDLNINSPVANAPNVIINQAAGQADPTNATPINLSVVFDQPVSGFTSGDVSLSSGSDTVTEVAPLDGTAYNVAVSGMADGVLTATVPAGVARNASSVGNNASTSSDNQIKFDSTPPIITLNGSATVTVECGDSYTELGATAADVCDPNVSVTIGGDTVDAATSGTYVVIYDAVDSAGNAAQVNRTVQVVDSTAPVITLNGPASVTLECGIDSYTEQGATAADACDPNVSVTVGGDTIDVTTPGSYVVTYDAVDEAGNAADQVSRAVEVVDTIAPELALLGDDPVIVIRNESYTESGADITEICDLGAAVVIGGDLVDPSVIGFYVVTYDATDSSGNGAIQLTRTVKVIPRFASIVGLVGNEKVKVDKDSMIDGSIGARLNVDLKENSELTGSITSVEAKVHLHDAAVGGDIDAGGKVDLHEASSLDGSITAGDDVKLKKQSTVGGDVISAGLVDLNDGASVGGTITENAVVPVLPGLPLPILNISAGGDDIEVGKDEALALPPGTYGKLKVKEGGTLILSSGSYVFEEMKVEKHSVIDLGLPITIDVETKLEFGEGVEMDANGGAAADLLIQVQGDECSLKKEGIYLGTFLAPSADIKLENNSVLTGVLVGKEVEVKKESTVNGEIALDLLITAAADWVELLTVLRLVGDGAPGYYEWAESHAVEGAPDDDDDQDGITNEMEHLLNLDPHEANTLPDPIITPLVKGLDGKKNSDPKADKQISWSLPVRSDLSTMPFLTDFEISTDLRSWTPSAKAGFSQSIEDGILSVSGPLASGKLFMRLGVRPHPTGNK